MKTNDEIKKEKTWETTKEPNLLRNGKSGRYYGRFKVAGKAKWFNCDTDDFKVAVVRLSEERTRISRTRLATAHVEAGVATMGEIAKIYRQQVQDSDLNEKSKRRYLEHVAAIEKTWPEFITMKPDRLTRGAVLGWRDRVRRDGTGFVPPGAKARSKMIDGTSPAGINKLIDAIRRMVGIAVERGQLAASPLQGRGLKLKATPRKPQLPEPDTLEAVFKNIESRGLGRPLDCAELCRALAYTGARISEAAELSWSDVDFGRGILRIHGTKTDTAEREVPMVPSARALLEKIRARRMEFLKLTEGEGAKLDPKAKVFQVAEASKALARACKEVGVAKLTHHDLRDAFTTSCIEAGVDIPTVAAWLGHADGGALLMRTYAHHRRAHGLTQAAKVTFRGAS